MDPILSVFSERLNRRLGKSLKELWLFGSRARGDNRIDSDYDVLVIADGSESVNRDIALDEGFHILDEKQQWIGMIVYTPEHWLQNRGTILGRNIDKEGIRFL